MAVVPQQSVHVRNLPVYPLDEIEELLFELFLQVGPVSKVYVPHDKKDGTHKGYAFVEFLHEESVPYSCKMLHGIKFLGFYIGVNPAALKLVVESEQSEETMQITNTITANDSDPSYDIPKSLPNCQSVETTPTYSPNLFGSHFPLQPPPIPPVMLLGPPPTIQGQFPLSIQPPIPPSMPVPPPIPPSMLVPPPIPPSLPGQPPPIPPSIQGQLPPIPPPAVSFPPLPPNFNQPLPSYHPSSCPFSFNIHHETIATPPLNMAQPPPNMSAAPLSCLPAPPNSYPGLPAPPCYPSSIPLTPHSFNMAATPTLTLADDAPESIVQLQQHNDFSRNSTPSSLPQQCTTDTAMNDTNSPSPSLIVESDITELDSTSDNTIDTIITTHRLITDITTTNPFKEAAKLLAQMKNTNSNNNINDNMADTRHHQKHSLCDISEENSQHELLNGHTEYQQDIELSHSERLISGMEQYLQTRLR